MRLRRRTAPAHAPVVWQTASVLLDYPGAHFRALRPDLPRILDGLPDEAAGPLTRFLAYADSLGPSELEAEYVGAFDHRRRGCLYLTYYSYGDTRKRGMALLRFKHAYRLAGLEVTEDELPDYLPLVLEFASQRPEGAVLLQEHRAGVELLRRSLEEKNSPWAPVMDAVHTTLPPLSGRAEDAVRRLAAEGPPEEEVGLPGYASTAAEFTMPEGARR